MKLKQLLKDIGICMACSIPILLYCVFFIIV